MISIIHIKSFLNFRTLQVVQAETVLPLKPAVDLYQSVAVYWSSTRRQTAILTGSKEMQKIATSKKVGKETTKETWAEGS